MTSAGLMLMLRHRAIVLALLAVTLCVPTASAQPAGTLQITLLGTGNPRPNMERFGPSILIEAGRSACSSMLAAARRSGSSRSGSASCSPVSMPCC